MRMVIRQFDLDRDYDSAVALWRTAGPDVHVGPSDSRDQIAIKLARDPDLFLAAEEGGRLVGTVIGGWDGRRGLIYHLAVAADFRQQGVGRRLMTEVEQRLTAKGCYKSYLLITQDNTDVMDFYRKLGWEAMPVQVMGKELW
jgi:ribosomal protein S18 acetylase RimI-like enzyme